MHHSHDAKRAIVFVVASILALAARAADAQYREGFLSLESRVAESDAVVRGTVDDVKFKPLNDGHGWLTVVIDVRETIKGTNTPKLEFAIWSDGIEDELPRWKKSGQEILWFLSRDKARKAQVQDESKQLPAPTEWVPASWYPIELAKSRSARVLTTQPPAVFLMDLTVREKPEEILTATRSIVQQQGSNPPLRRHQIAISHALAEQSGSAGDANDVIVPVDARLEANARKWISTPGEVVDRLDKSQVKDKHQRDEWLAYERDNLREQGVRALKYFPSDENIVLLRGLLNDPAWISETRNRDGVEITNKVYHIRKAAYAVLNKWDVPVERPHISEPAPYDKTSAAAQPQHTTITSSDDWRTRIVLSDGLSLSVSLPGTVTPGHVPLQLVVFNRGEKVAQIGETGYALDCKIALQTEDGRVWKLTRLGDAIFGEKENGGQYAFIRLRQDNARRWEYNLAEAFEELTPGRYRLTLEAKVEFRNNVSGEFSDTKTLVAKDLMFQVKEANKSR
jgi:hypothetical protein